LFSDEVTVPVICLPCAKIELSGDRAVSSSKHNPTFFSILIIVQFLMIT